MSSYALKLACMYIRMHELQDLIGCSLPVDIQTKEEMGQRNTET